MSYEGVSGGSNNNDDCFYLLACKSLTHDFKSALLILTRTEIIL